MFFNKKEKQQLFFIIINLIIALFFIFSGIDFYVGETNIKVYSLIEIFKLN